ncbi:MAG: serine/threonine protein kinase, partial [Chloroflexota bacterium]
MFPGDVLQDRYECLDRLGAGGQGSVYLAADRRLHGKKWAIKELQDADPALHDKLRQQFEEEARVLAHLDHNGLPKVSDYFTENDRHYLVMEFVDGDDLDAVVERQGGRLPEARAIEIGRQICTILEYLHGQRPEPVIHRDLKPANIKITSAGQVKLVDFGLAKMAAPGDLSKTAVRGSGTPGFSPLEQYSQQGGTDQRSDLYSLGCCLYFLLTTVVPPEAPDRYANPRLLRPVRAANPGVSAELAQLVEKAMALNASDR